MIFFFFFLIALSLISVWLCLYIQNNLLLVSSKPNDIIQTFLKKYILYLQKLENKTFFFSFFKKVLFSLIFFLSNHFNCFLKKNQSFVTAYVLNAEQQTLFFYLFIF